MDMRSRDGAREASITKFEVDGRTAWHLEMTEDGELVFDCNTSLEECLDWLNRLGNREAIDIVKKLDTRRCF